MNLVDDDPRRATIDHILPLSKGGTDAPTNLRAACLQCNNERGNGEPPKESL
jgi:5-methylcytosine-specific restriction endonuclease McrA